jgi:cysteine desulfurase
MYGLIYMDHAATTPVAPEVRRDMSLYFTEYSGNPATLYSLGISCAKAVGEARARIAALIGAKPEEIYFTSGGTESDNWAVKGIAYAHERKGNHIITSAIEHHAVLETCDFMEKCGFKVTRVKVDKYGMVSPDDVRAAITDKTILISVMHANNEVGTLQPIAEIGAIAKERGILFHTDAVQTVGKIPVNVQELKCDMLSVSAHKFYGPKGVGIMYLRKGVKIEPYMHGGGQENNKRAGTHNVPGIVGMGKAAELAGPTMKAEDDRIRVLRDRLQKGILERIPDVQVNGHPTQRLAGILNVCVEGVEGEAMLLCLDMNRICVSSGSACTTGSLEPSHVLLAMGIPAERAHGSVRFALGHENTEEQIAYVVDTFASIVSRLRQMSPTYKKK